MAERNYDIFRFGILVSLVEDRLVPYLFGIGSFERSRFLDTALTDRGLSVGRSYDSYKSRLTEGECCGFTGFYIPPRGNARRSRRKLVRTRNPNFRSARKNQE